MLFIVELYGFVEETSTWYVLNVSHRIRIQQLNMKEVSSRTSQFIALWQFLSLVNWIIVVISMGALNLGFWVWIFSFSVFNKDKTMNYGTVLHYFWLDPCCMQQYNIEKIRCVTIVVRNTILKVDSSLHCDRYCGKLTDRSLPVVFQCVIEIIHSLANSDGRRKTFDVLFLGAFAKLLKKRLLAL